MSSDVSAGGSRAGIRLRGTGTADRPGRLELMREPAYGCFISERRTAHVLSETQDQTCFTLEWQKKVCLCFDVTDFDL